MINIVFNEESDIKCFCNVNIVVFFLRGCCMLLLELVCLLFVLINLMKLKE